MYCEGKTCETIFLVEITDSKRESARVASCLFGVRAGHTKRATTFTSANRVCAGFKPCESLAGHRVSGVAIATVVTNFERPFKSGEKELFRQKIEIPVRIS